MIRKLASTGNNILYEKSHLTKGILLQTWSLSVDPLPLGCTVNWTSVSANPNRSILHHTARIYHRNKLLKHVINVLICDDRQCRILSQTKRSCITPIRHWTVGVETVVLNVHRVTFGHLNSSGYRHDWYITCKIQQGLFTSAKKDTYFNRRLFVCLSVCLSVSNFAQTITEQVFMKIFTKDVSVDKEK